MEIGKYLKDTLKDQGRSQRWLALKIGMNEKTLSGRFARGNFSAADLILIGEALDINLNIFKEHINLNELKGNSNSPAYYGVYKVYEEAIDCSDFKSVIKSISVNLQELDASLRPTLATVVIYMIECDVTYEEFVELMCSEFWTIEQLLENYYWFYPHIKTDSELLEVAKTQSKDDLIANLPHVFTAQGCLVLCEPPFTRFEGDKLYYFKPSND